MASVNVLAYISIQFHNDQAVLRANIKTERKTIRLSD